MDVLLFYNAGGVAVVFGVMMVAFGIRLILEAPVQVGVLVTGF